MQEYKIILTWEAIYDVTDIADYIEEEFGQQRADRFQSDLKEQMQNLSQFSTAFPGRGLYEFAVDIPFIKILFTFYYFLYYNGRNKRDSYSPSVAP